MWEGVRHDEYKFTELPKVVQEKEAERVYRRLVDSSIKASDLTRVPMTDRRDFVTAYGDGRHKAACQILDRDGFRENMFVGNARVIQHVEATKGKEQDAITIADKASVPTTGSEKPKSAPEKNTMRDLNLAAVDLSGMKNPGAVATVPASEIPRAGDAGERVR